jgi:hypothetical protein
MRGSSSTNWRKSLDEDVAKIQADELVKFLDMEFLKEIENMAKKEETKNEKTETSRKVKFSITDGKLPKKADEPGNPFLLRMPMTTSVPPKSKRTVSLGVSCALPLVMVRQGEAKLVPPNEELKVELGGEFVTTVGEDEVVARLYVLDNGNVEATR